MEVPKALLDLLEETQEELEEEDLEDTDFCSFCDAEAAFKTLDFFLCHSCQGAFINGQQHPEAKVEWVNKSIKRESGYG